LCSRKIGAMPTDDLSVPLNDGTATLPQGDISLQQVPFVPAPPASTIVSTLDLFRFATPSDRAVLVFASVCALAQGASNPFMAKLLQNLLTGVFYPNDDGSLPPVQSAHHERDHLVLKSFLTFCILGAATFLVTLGAYLGFSRVADRMVLQLRRGFFDQLLQKDVGWYDTHSGAEMATRLTNDTYDFRQATGEKLAQLLVGISMFPAGFVVAFTVDWRLTLAMLVTLPILAGGMAVTIKMMSKSSSEEQERYSKAGGVAETTISSVRTVAAFDGFARELQKYNSQLQSAERFGIESGMWNAFAMGISQTLTWGTFSFGFWFGSLLVIHDVNNQCWGDDPKGFGNCFTGATMISCLFATLYGGLGLGTVAQPMAALASGKAAAARIYAVLDQPPAFDVAAGIEPDSFEGHIEFREVVFHYPSRLDVPALDRASFTVAAGKTVAFVGPSGSGKSTTVALLQRYYDTTSGSVLLDGLDLRTLKMSWVRSKMALVQQEPVLFCGSILENISYGKDGSTEADVKKAAKAANAHNFISVFPDGYRTEVGERGTQMSGGQKQRIAIARAMIRDPVVLILDEATSALDTESERVVQKALDELVAQRSRTTLVIAHRLSTVKDADEIFVLENGTLLERGTHHELMQKTGSLYAQLVKLQDITAVDGQSSDLQRNASRLKSADSSTIRRNTGQSAHSAHSSANGEDDKEKEQEMPPEDNEDIKVPTMRLWVMQRKNLGLLAVALLCTIPTAVLRPFFGYLFSDITNLFSTPPAMVDVATLRQGSNRRVVEFSVLAAILGICTFGQMGCFRVSAERLTRLVRFDTFKAMLRQEMSWFDVRTSGHLADRLASEAPLIKTFTGENLATVLQFVGSVGAGVGIAAYYSWRLTLFTVVFLPLVMMGSAILFSAMKRKNTTTAGPLVSEAMGNIRTVASFGMKDRLLQRYEELLQLEAAQDRRSTTATGLAAAYNGGVTFVMFGSVIFVANFFIGKDWMDPKDTLNVLFPILFCAQGAAMASVWQADKAKAQRAINHIFKTIDRTPMIDAYDSSGDRLASASGQITFNHVVFKYPSRPENPIFTDFHLEIEAGKSVAFCGPSGSGKSTTIALLQRFYDADSGSVCFDGHDIKTLNLSWLRAQMALVQQEPILFAGTISENIAYGREGATLEECQEAAKTANAHSFIGQFSQGYDTEVGDRGAQLSGGQKQRVAIARCMVRNPAVLLLDEATSALDTESERSVQEALDKLVAEGRRTTIVIAHRLSTIVNSDMICVIYKGQIVERGTHTDLLKIPNGQYKQLAARQDLYS